VTDGSASDLRVCVDFGSTFTKACVVDLTTATVIARASHRTTVDTDVLDGFAACRAELDEKLPGAALAPVLACSSAGGGLRIAVVGNEELVTSEAGRRVALSSGGRVVHVASGLLTDAAVAELREQRPDVLLLVGGTDGGNAEVLEHNADMLAVSGLGLPVVLAGNRAVSEDIRVALTSSGVAVEVCANVMPRIGAFDPGPARAALRAAFLSHVIGGKHLSGSGDFAAMVRGATPDVMLAAVELMAHGVGADRAGWGDIAVVDVGGATTDVYSVVEVDPESVGRDVVGAVDASRTVEGDLGVRWSAVSTVAEACAAGLVPEGDRAEAERQAAARQADPGLVAEDHGWDLRLAGWAAALAVRRHAGRAEVRFESSGGAPARVVERTGTDLREVGVLVGSGGVLRHAAAEEARAAVTEHLSANGGWQVPESATVVVDRDYVLMPVGLLAGEHPDVAYGLLDALRG
jgi:uncharacterized protein (TIGR01319 family)